MQLNWKENARVIANNLKRHVDATQFNFKTTDDLEALTSIVGQERGRTVMNFGLNIKQEGYNLYVSGIPGTGDRKSTRLNSSHVSISYAVFCLKKKIE